eukprot:TRINITY_DN8501_c0_g1_i1.p1 TRINITY_DN8501_c0_g1~~TRINITY_DN8501_c0_g1_i1.p1  ORF type:complete len:268 (-),score=37.15 TRINITY_DN8501_c0_g1_i1:236-1039(-)
MCIRDRRRVHGEFIYKQKNHIDFETSMSKLLLTLAAIVAISVAQQPTAETWTLRANLSMPRPAESLLVRKLALDSVSVWFPKGGPRMTTPNTTFERYNTPVPHFRLPMAFPNETEAKKFDFYVNGAFEELGFIQQNTNGNSTTYELILRVGELNKKDAGLFYRVIQKTKEGDEYAIGLHKEVSLLNRPLLVGMDIQGAALQKDQEHNLRLFFRSQTLECFTYKLQIVLLGELCLPLCAINIVASRDHMTVISFCLHAYQSMITAYSP